MRVLFSIFATALLGRATTPLNHLIQTIMDNDKTSSCPVCGAIIRPDEKTCPHCKEVLWTDEIPDELGSGSATDVSDGTPPPMLGEIHNRDFRPEPDTSPETEEAEPPRRIRGWFYFFVFIVFMSTFRTLVALISEPQTTPFLLYGITSIGLSVYVLVQLAWGKSNAIFLCKSLLIISLTFYVCMVFIIFALSNREPIPLLLVAFIAPIMCLIWLGYFECSKQVERLFPSKERSHSALDVLIVIIAAIPVLVIIYNLFHQVN